VYIYLDQKNIPFYVGKGKGNRYFICDHSNKKTANEFLKNKIRKVGKENIRIHFLHENLFEEEAFFWERYWINYIGRRDLKEGTLCNLTNGGEGPSGNLFSEESKQKLSMMRKGRKLTEETKRKIGKANKGKTHTKETRQKLSIAGKGRVAWNKGIPRSDDTKRKISKANTGHQHTEETKRKMSETHIKNPFWKNKRMSEDHKRKLSETHKGKPSWNKGIPMSEESKQKLSIKMKGKKHTKETKRKISITLKNKKKGNK